MIEMNFKNFLAKVEKKLFKMNNSRFPVKRLLFSVTNHCNAHCPMFFRYKELNKKTKIISLDEIKKFFSSLGKLETVFFSGGEPFLRKDLDQICRILIKKNGNPLLGIPTNGSLPTEIYKKTKKILSYGARELYISFSLDGSSDFHNKNRGINGLFKKIHESYELLVDLKKIYPQRLKVRINTCISKSNIEQTEFLFKHISQNMKLAEWVIEPIRGDFNKNEANALSIKEWEKFYLKIKSYHQKQPLLLTKDTLNLFRYSIKTLKEKRQIVPCVGGDEFIVLDHKGNLHPCETLPGVLNIKDINYDINQLLTNAKWQKVLMEIKQGKCYCTHFCWMLFSYSKYRHN